MRILMVHSSYRAPGGEDVSAAMEARLLRRRGHEVEEVHFGSADIGEGAAAAVRAVWNRKAAQKISARLTKFRPDVLHVQNLFPAASPAVLSIGVSSLAAVVQTLRNQRLVCAAGTGWWKGRPCAACGPAPLTGVLRGCWRGSRSATAVATTAAFVHRRMLAKVDLVITPSEYLKAAVQLAVPQPIVVVPNAVDVTPSRETVREGMLFAGRLVEEKGVHDLLAALSHLPSDVPVTVMGDGPLRHLVPEAVERNPTLRWLGQCSHAAVMEAMQAARVVVVPSRWPEPFGRTALEAMAAGCAVVAAKTGGLPEVIGDAGILVEPSDPGGLARALVTALQDWEWYGAAARTRYAEVFDDGGAALEDALVEAVRRKRSASIRKAGITDA